MLKLQFNKCAVPFFFSKNFPFVENSRRGPELGPGPENVVPTFFWARQGPKPKYGPWALIEALTF